MAAQTSSTQAPTVSSHPELVAIIQKCMLESVTTGQRTIVVLRGAPSGWLECFARCHEVLLLNELSAEHRADRADRITALLGSERLILAYAFARSAAAPDASLFAAAAGSLQTGGVLLLETETAQQIELQNTSATGYKSARAIGHQSNFRQRFERLLQREISKSPSWICSVVYTANRPECASSQACKEPRCIVPDTFHVSTSYQRQALQEQNAILRQITSHLSKNTQSSTLISGRRGRGKSALLARLASDIAAQGSDFAVTANHQSALSSFKRHFSGADSPIISHMHAMQRRHDILLVDEAGNLSVRQLRTLLCRHQHVVFCSTSEGYENAGRAFINRFSTELAASEKPLLKVVLHSPWRWTQNDCLENLVDDLLLCRRPESYLRRINALKQETQKLVNSCICRLVPQSELTRDDHLLHNIHYLLSENHYQSSIKDLQHLLDSESMQVWAGIVNETVVAALVLVLEGDIHHELHTPVIEGKRRLPHQLLPQMLAVKSGNKNILAKRYARVVRIAVVSPLRRCGLASALLQSMEKALMSDGEAVTAVGASFARDAGSRSFWKSNGYTEFHEGLKVNPRSGATSVFVLKSCDMEIDQAVSTLDMLPRSARS